MAVRPLYGMSHINVEIKAHCTNPQRIRDLLRERHAEFRGTDRQIDTYFSIVYGRLKLREGRIENALIHYQRDNQPHPKQSDVILCPLAPGSPVKDVLAAALGVLVVVAKQREIYFIENVKFHLDLVDGLGSFVEIEAIDLDGTRGKAALLAQCQSFLQLFEIPPHDLVAESYSDLLLARQRLASRDS